MKMHVYLDVQNHDGVSEEWREQIFTDETTLGELSKCIRSFYLVPEDYQQLYHDGNQIVMSQTSLNSKLVQIGVKNHDEIVIKHAHLPKYLHYQDLVKQVTKNRTLSVIDIAKEAAQLDDLLWESQFFWAYSKLSKFRRERISELRHWNQPAVVSMRKATEEFFRNLHDRRIRESENEKKQEEEEKFVCCFKPRNCGGSRWCTLAFVRIHGDEAFCKYNVKPHSAVDHSYYSDPQVTEVYCYQLLALIGVGPPVQFIPGPNKTLYIATRWEYRFERLEKSRKANRLCANVAVQLNMLSWLLYITDIDGNNCGMWKGTQDAAIVDFSPEDNYRVHNHWKYKFTETLGEFRAVRNKQGEDSWMKMSKMYFDRWDLAGKVELARQKSLIENGLLERLENDFTDHDECDSPAEEIDEYIDVLKQNLENLREMFDSVV